MFDLQIYMSEVQGIQKLHKKSIKGYFYSPFLKYDRFKTFWDQWMEQ